MQSFTKVVLLHPHTGRNSMPQRVGARTHFPRISIPSHFSGSGSHQRPSSHFIPPKPPQVFPSLTASAEKEIRKIEPARAVIEAKKRIFFIKAFLGDSKNSGAGYSRRRSNARLFQLQLFAGAWPNVYRVVVFRGAKARICSRVPLRTARADGVVPH
jgi:hypothetical protein